MKRLGLIGGMSWESTQVYYAELNRQIAKRLQGLHSADLVLTSVDFAPIATAQANGEWQQLGAMLAQRARELEAAGAELLMICTNTMHKVARAVEQAIDIPLLHVADASGEALKHRRIQQVALLGTQFTMADPFYRDHLRERFSIEVMVPCTRDQARLHDIIFTELCRGCLRSESESAVLSMIDELLFNGAEGVLLGCTELGMLIEPRDGPQPILDTTLLHVDYALSKAM